MILRQAALTQTMHGYSSTTIQRFAMKLYLTVAGKKARNISPYNHVSLQNPLYITNIVSQYKFKYSVIIDAYVEAFSFKTFLLKAKLL